MKNIYIRLVGGIGNQLFIYAFGLSKSKKTKKKLFIDNVSGFGKRDRYGGVFSLGNFAIKDNFASKNIFYKIIFNRFFWYLIKKMRLCFIEKDSTAYDKTVKNTKKIFFEGYWQSYLYFDEYKNDIKKDLRLINPNNKKINRYKNKIIESKNSVAIGMRFYEAFPEDAETYGVCGYEYYSKSIEYIESQTTDITYFIFSLNIKRAKKQLEKFKNKRFIFIEPQNEIKDAYLDMHLMSLCKHFIISNSTMYWWAAYLGEKTDSITTYPSNGLYNKDVMLPNWIKI